MQQPKMGGQAVTRLLIKGNDDLTNALLSKADGGAHLDMGVKEQIAEQFNGRFTIETIVEPSARIEMLSQQLSGVTFPENLKENGLADALESQFNSRIFTEESDILLLSIQPDLVATLWRNQADGTLVSPPENWEAAWSQEQVNWFKQNYTLLNSATADEYKESLTQVIQALKEKTSAHIVMFGSCSYEAANEPHNLSKSEETLTMQTHRLNLVMLELSFAEGITFIDVDRLLAEMGCENNVIKRFHYSKMAYEAIRDDFIRVITDVGFFEERPLLVQMGHRSR